MRAFSRKVVGDEKNPYRIAQKLFAAVDRIPWAGAREYSTISNISDYALHAGHADCGQQTLLLITLLRLNGIPARWQSGMVFSDSGYNNIHDWGQVYLAPYGWVPMDVTTGLLSTDKGNGDDPAMEWFYLGGLDNWRIAFNDDWSQPFHAAEAALPLRQRRLAARRSRMERRQPVFQPMGLRLRMADPAGGAGTRGTLDHDFQPRHPQYRRGEGNEQQPEYAQARALHGDGAVPGVHGLAPVMAQSATGAVAGRADRRRRRSPSPIRPPGFTRTVTAGADGSYRLSSCCRRRLHAAVERDGAPSASRLPVSVSHWAAPPRSTWPARVR